MAARLTVIMVHSPPANAAAQKIAESVVGEIIGRPGIDLTLVGPLKQIALQSTDRLTLESITGDVAAMDWRTPDDLVQTLNEIGFPGVRAPHANDPDATNASSGNAPNQRRIYAFDLNQTTDAKQLCVALNNLLSQRQVRTFTLGTISSAKAPSAPTQISPKPRAQKPAPPTPPAKESDQLPAERSKKAGGSFNLDDLVDQLDQLDP